MRLSVLCRSRPRQDARLLKRHLSVSVLRSASQERSLYSLRSSLMKPLSHFHQVLRAHLYTRAKGEIANMPVPQGGGRERRFRQRRCHQLMAVARAPTTRCLRVPSSSENNVGNGELFVIGLHGSGEAIARFLKDWEVAKVALSCHTALDMLVHESYEVERTRGWFGFLNEPSPVS